MNKFHAHFFVAIFAGIIIILTKGMASSSLHVNATDTTLSYTVERLADYDADYSTAQPGDYKITLNISSNTGVNACALLLTYDADNFMIFDEETSTGINEETSESYTYSNIPVVEHYAQFGIPLATTFSYAPGLIRFVSVAANTSYRNGEAFSIYLRPSANCSSITPLLAVNVVYWKMSTTTGTLTDVPVSVTSTVNNEYHYLVGDIDGDCTVGLFDVMIVNEVFTEYGAIYEVQFTNQFGEYVNVVCFNVVDVNGDGVIDSSDATELLTYHNRTNVMDEPYVGIIGNEEIYIFTTSISVTY